MTELEINVESIYEDQFIDSVQIVQGDNEVSGRMNDQVLRVTNSGTYSHEHGESYLPEGCLLDFEVITPEPLISVEVSHKEVSENKVEFASWSFTGTNAFENWVEKNNIELVTD